MYVIKIILNIKKRGMILLEEYEGDKEILEKGGKY